MDHLIHNHYDNPKYMKKAPKIIKNPSSSTQSSVINNKIVGNKGGGLVKKARVGKY